MAWLAGFFGGDLWFELWDIVDMLERIGSCVDIRIYPTIVALPGSLIRPGRMCLRCAGRLPLEHDTARRKKSAAEMPYLGLLRIEFRPALEGIGLEDLI